MAVIGTRPDLDLLNAMELDLTRPDSGCCGMAGSFGYERGEHYDVSTAAAERVLLPEARAADPATLILADGFSCRSQIEERTDRQPLHLAEALALASQAGDAQ